MRYVGAPSTSFGEDRRKYVVGSGGVSVGQTVFNVSYDEGKVDAYLNGVRLFPDTDFTKTASGVGSNITLTSGVASGDVLELQGLQGVHGGNGLVEDRFVVGTDSTGSGGAYDGDGTNWQTVFPIASNAGDTVSVWRNGVKLVHTTDYTVQPSASTVTLGSAATASDEICIQVVGIVTSANFIPKTGGTFTGEVVAPTLKLSSNVIKASDGGSTITLDTSDNVTIAGGLTVTQDFTVNGTTTTVDTTNTVVKDSLIGLNNGASSNTNDCGLIIERGSTGNDALFMWDESEDKFTLGTSTSTASSTGNLNITVGTLVANIEGNVTGDVTGNASGTAATVTGATQSNITSVGTLTSATISGDLTVDTSTLKVDSSNNRVGVGTASPSSLLHLESDNLTNIDKPLTLKNAGTGSTLANTFTAIKFQVGDANAGPSESGHIGAGQVGESGTWSDDSRMMFWVGNAGPTVSNPKMVIDGSGKVGIGISSSITDALHVKTTAVETRISLESSTGKWAIGAQDGDKFGILNYGTSTPFIIDSAGNVGIGVTPESGISADASSLQVGDLLSFSAWTGANANDFHALSYNAYKTGSDSWKAQRTSSSADYRPSQYAQAYGQHYFRVATSATADSAISFSNAMTIDNSGNVEINDGDLKIGTAGHGIEFNSGGDSSLLDDYEEGTYNPSITGSSTAASGVNFSSRHGEYTKIGNIIHVSIHINMTSYTSGPTGTSLWCTLPFSAHSTHVPAATVGYTANWDRRPVAGIVAGGTDRLYLYVSDVSSSSNVTAGTGVTNATGDDINGTSEIFLQASYSMH